MSASMPAVHADLLSAEEIGLAVALKRRFGADLFLRALEMTGERLSKRVTASAPFADTAHDLKAARRADHQLCPQKCGRCSRCIHSRAWSARGGRDFLGVEAEAALREAES